eukprot:gene4939-8536_t
MTTEGKTKVITEENEKNNFKILLGSLDKEYDKISQENVELKKKIKEYQKLISQYEQQLGISKEKEKEKNENRAQKFVKQVVDFTKKVNINQKLGGIHFEEGFNTHTDIITSVQFLPNYTKDTFISSTSTDGNCFIWQPGKKNPVIAYTGHSGAVNKSSFHPTQNLACSFSGDGSFHLWKFDIPNSLDDLDERDSNASIGDDIDTQDLITESEFKTDDNEFTEMIEDNEIAVPLNKEQLKTLTIQSPSSRKNSDNRLNDLRELDLVDQSRNTTKLVDGCLKKVQIDSVVISGEWFSDGKSIATASWDKCARLFAVSGSEVTQTMIFKGHEDSLNGISIGNQNSLIVTCSDDCTARIWDIRTSEQVHILKAHNISTTNALFNASDRVIITGGNDGLVKFWDVKNLKNPLKTCNIHYAINTIAISNYHSRICIGSTKRHGQIYDLSGTLLETFPVVIGIMMEHQL